MIWRDSLLLMLIRCHTYDAAISVADGAAEALLRCLQKALCVARVYTRLSYCRAMMPLLPSLFTSYAS